MHPSEYIQGFYSTPMEDDEASFGTKVDYTHHQLRLPNEDLANGPAAAITSSRCLIP